jgi:ribonucleoside-triphosphate reductase
LSRVDGNHPESTMSPFSFFIPTSAPGYTAFQLDKTFLSRYVNKKPSFGWDVFGEFIYLRTYSRVKDNGENEVWYETVERVVNGTFNMQKKWFLRCGLEWSDVKAQYTAQMMYDRIFHMKFLPPGRGLWAMGSPLTEELGLFAALNNCAFISTESIDDVYRPAKCFAFLMDASLLGVGVGFDTKGAGKVLITSPKMAAESHIYWISDSREGWVESTEILINSYLKPNSILPQFDYSRIRPRGSPIRGFGGIAGGPELLRELHESLKVVLNRNLGRMITVTTLVDIMNLIGKCVAGSSVRQTAEIAFGDANCQEYLDLKNYHLNLLHTWNGLYGGLSTGSH